MEQAFPALSKTLNTSMALNGLALSPKEQLLLQTSDLDAQVYLANIGKCQHSMNPAANTKCILEAIAHTPKCKGEYQDLVGCAKKLALSGPENVKSNLKACRKPERVLSRCVDDMVADLLDTLSGKKADFVIFDKLERIDD